MSVDLSGILQSSGPAVYAQPLPQFQPQMQQQFQQQMQYAPQGQFVQQQPPVAPQAAKRKTPTAQERRIASAYSILMGKDRFGLEYIKLLFPLRADEKELHNLMAYTRRIYGLDRGQ